MLQGAMEIGSITQAREALETIIVGADTLPQDVVRRRMAQMDAAALEWEYGTSDPEEQLERLWNETKAIIFFNIETIMAGAMPVSEAQLELGTTLELAIAATESITIAAERFYALQSIGNTALHTRNTDQAIAAFTRSLSLADRLDSRSTYEPMNVLIEQLSEYDLPTSTHILTQVLEGMDIQTADDEIKLGAWWAIAQHLTELRQPARESTL